MADSESIQSISGSRIAFQDSGQQFGLASAISTVIFLIVAAITLLQMRFTRIAQQDNR